MGEIGSKFTSAMNTPNSMLSNVYNYKRRGKLYAISIFSFGPFEKQFIVIINFFIGSGTTQSGEDFRLPRVFENTAPEVPFM